MKRLKICVWPRNRQRKEARNSIRSVSIFSQNYTKSLFETPLLTYPEVLEIYRLVKIIPASMFFKRHSCHVKNSRLGHALLISVNDRVISALCDGFIFTKPRRCKNFRIYSINLRCKPKCGFKTLIGTFVVRLRQIYIFPTYFSPILGSAGKKPF